MKIFRLYQFTRDGVIVGRAFPLCEECAKTQKIPEGLELTKMDNFNPKTCSECDPQRG